MEITEKELEDIIVNTDRKKLMERGLCFIPSSEAIRVKVMRQTDLRDAGRSDVIMAYRYYSEQTRRTVLVINVIELKKDKLFIDAVSQVLRYVYSIFLYLINERGFSKEDFRINPILIGQRVTDDLGFVPHILNIDSSGRFINRFAVFVFKFNIDGMFFEDVTPRCKPVRYNDFGLPF